MITKESMSELEVLVEQDSTKNCYEFAKGMMFAIRDGDTSCLTGRIQKSGEVEVNGQKMTIYIGGAIKK